MRDALMKSRLLQFLAIPKGTILMKWPKITSNFWRQTRKIVATSKQTSNLFCANFSKFPFQIKKNFTWKNSSHIQVFQSCLLFTH